jgi:hypothetical protein
MSQFTLTQEEDAIITDALRSKAAQYAAMFGVADPALEALIAKLESYNPETPAVVEQPADLVEPTEEEIEAHAAAEEPTATDETSVAE